MSLLGKKPKAKMTAEEEADSISKDLYNSLKGKVIKICTFPSYLFCKI